MASLSFLYLFGSLLLAQPPAAARDLFEQARSALNANNFDLAIAKLTEGIHLDPRNPAAYLVRGSVYGLLDRVDEAINDLSGPSAST